MKLTSPTVEALGLLGLAMRAGAAVKGTDGTRRALKAGEANLVILAADGSKTQLRKVVPLAEARGVPQRMLGTRAELGAAVGGGPLTAVAVTGRRFAKELLVRMGGGERDGGRNAQRR